VAKRLLHAELSGKKESGKTSAGAHPSCWGGGGGEPGGVMEIFF